MCATISVQEPSGSRSVRVLPLSLLLAASLWGAAACGPVYYPPAGAQPAAAAPVASGPQAYFGELGAYGRWVWTRRWGEVWVPYANSQPYWRPYYLGHWAYTEYGWTWASDEPWGWGPYHYGRWTWHASLRWVWIPGTTWGPAWVSWRVGGGCVGWAPLGPVGYEHDHHSYWVFVSKQNIQAPHVQQVVVRPERVTKVYNQSQSVGTDVTIRNRDGRTVVYNSGPSREAAQQWTRKRIEPRPASGVPGAVPRRTPWTDPRARSGRSAAPRPDAGGAARGSPRGPGAVGPGRLRPPAAPRRPAAGRASGPRPPSRAGRGAAPRVTPRDGGPGSPSWRPERPPYARPPTTRPGGRGREIGPGTHRPGSAARPPGRRPPPPSMTGPRGRGSASAPPRVPGARRPGQPKPYYGNHGPSGSRASPPRPSPPRASPPRTSPPRASPPRTSPPRASAPRVDRAPAGRKPSARKKRYRPHPPRSLRAPREVPKHVRVPHRDPPGRGGARGR